MTPLYLYKPADCVEILQALSSNASGKPMVARKGYLDLQEAAEGFI